VLTERGDGAAIARHPRFRIFAAMNPATDVGKRDLPAALKHRFTELYAGECEGREDLALLVSGGLSTVPAAPVAAVVDFYLAARADAVTTLLDSADQKPQYSLRTLSRAMEYVRSAAPLYGVQRALYDGFAMSFQTLLQAPSAALLERLMVKHLLKGTPLKVHHTLYTIHPKPLYPLPCTLYPIPYTLYPIPYTLYPILSKEKIDGHGLAQLRSGGAYRIPLMRPQARRQKLSNWCCP
jgi:midasin (ATPase involved in ribosome maturation)